MLLILSIFTLPNQSTYHHENICTCVSELTLPQGGYSSATVKGITDSLLSKITLNHLSRGTENPPSGSHSLSTAKVPVKTQI